MRDTFIINQKRDNPNSWCIKAIRDYPRGNKRVANIAFEIYSGKLPLPDCCVIIPAKRWSFIDSAVDAIVSEISAFDEVTTSDKVQITEFVKHILPKGN